MQITHAEAQRLIQFSLDQTLRPQEKDILQTHLNDCIACRNFAGEIKEMETLLAPTMRRHWNRQPAPLSMEAITAKGKTHRPPSLLLVTRTAIISLVFAAFAFSAWQFTVSNNRASTPIPVGVLPIPTPSGQSTSTKISYQSCQEILYHVRENDSLESIAAQFAVSKDQLLAINNLDTEAIDTDMDLLIPICSSTPTGTAYPSSLTTTFTPLSKPTTSTPNG